jgi:hypothetical protein
VKGITFALLAGAVAQCLIVASVAGQPDLAAALIGTWDEESSSDRGDEGDGRRRLVIQSVEKTAEGWTVDGRYGHRNEALGKPQTELQVIRGEAVLTVRPSTGEELHLRLQDHRYLVGSDRGPSRVPAASIRFEKKTK